MPDEESKRLLELVKDGDEAAAEAIFDRYVHRLVALANQRLSPKMRRRVLPEDVVQSALRCFFHQAKEDRYELKRSGDLWRLLAAITVNKVLGKVEYHRALKRSVADERSVGGSDAGLSVPVEVVAQEPTPLVAAALVEELETFMTGLSPLERTILELRLQDYSSEAISERVRRSSRTVRRTLERLRETLQARIIGDDDSQVG